MNKTFRERVAENWSDLSMAQRKVAGFLLGNQFESAMEGITWVRRQVGVNQATVVRTVKRLGYDKWSDLRTELVRHTINNIHQHNGVGRDRYDAVLEKWRRFYLVYGQHNPTVEEQSRQVTRLLEDAIRETDDILDRSLKDKEPTVE